MKVSELIAVLEQIDPNIDVDFVHDRGNYGDEIGRITIVSFTIEKGLAPLKICQIEGIVDAKEYSLSNTFNSSPGILYGGVEYDIIWVSSDLEK